MLLLALLSPTHSIYQSYLQLSSLGYEFQPRNPTQLLLTAARPNQMRCAVSCNQQPSCRAIDYDSSSGRCRLFEGDLTAGSIVPSASTTSIVGVTIVPPSLLAQTQSQSQSCQACQESRYEICAASTCQCRSHTVWDQSTCSIQLFENDTCAQADACRSDLNLTCVPDVNGQLKCLSGRNGNGTDALSCEL